MLNQIGSNTSMEIASAVLAIQHLLIAKGVCSLDEFTIANKRSQDLLKNLTASMTVEGTPNLVSALTDTVEFLGGASALESLKNVLSEIDESKSEGGD